MHQKRVVYDSLFVTFSLFLFAILMVFLERILPINNLEQGSVLTGFSASYSIFFYFVLIIIFFLYGWSLTRWFVKKDLEKNDNPLKHIYLIFLPLFLIITVNYIAAYLLPLSQVTFYYQLSTEVFVILQIITISTTFGIFLYPQIEERLGILIYKKNLQGDETKLGLYSLQKQVRYYSKKYWKILLFLLGIVIMLANFLLFIIYPSIPVESNLGLSFFYPNFNFSYDPSTGYRQKFFNYITIPSSVLVDWKLVQSILSLLIFSFILILIYLPNKLKTTLDAKNDEIKENPKSEDTQENIAYNVLTPSIELIEYSPTQLIKNDKQKNSRKFLQRGLESDFIKVMGLLCFNFTLSIIIIFILQNMGVITSSSLQADTTYNDLFIEVSQLYWAGFAEEISFRWLIFGLPLFLIYGLIFLILKILHFTSKDSATKQEKNIKSRFLSKINKTNPFLYLIGGWKRIDFIGVLFLIFSSLCFGYTHYANGWDSWKIFQAGIAGLIFGYAYIKYGLHAAIFLHASNDFILGYLITPNYGLIINGEFLYLVLTFLGAFILLYAFLLVLSKFFKGLNHMFNRYEK